MQDGGDVWAAAQFWAASSPVSGLADRVAALGVTARIVLP